MRWLTSGEICKELRVTPTTIKTYCDSGKLRVRKVTARKFLYDIDSLLEKDNEINKLNKINICYARVSNTKQKDDLQRQTSLIKEFMVKNGIKPDQVITDIASGMNENRPGFNTLIDLIVHNKVDKVYITYKDRLTRFGFEYFQNLFQLYNTTIEVINLTDEQDYQQELLEDFTSIIHHFSMKMYSNRRKVLKQLKIDLENTEE